MAAKPLTSADDQPPVDNRHGYAGGYELISNRNLQIVRAKNSIIGQLTLKAWNKIGDTFDHLSYIGIHYTISPEAK